MVRKGQKRRATSPAQSRATKKKHRKLQEDDVLERGAPATAPASPITRYDINDHKRWSRAALVQECNKFPGIIKKTNRRDMVNALNAEMQRRAEGGAPSKQSRKPFGKYRAVSEDDKVLLHGRLNQDPAKKCRPCLKDRRRCVGSAPPFDQPCTHCKENQRVCRPQDVEASRQLQVLDPSEEGNLAGEAIDNAHPTLPATPTDRVTRPGTKLVLVRSMPETEAQETQDVEDTQFQHPQAQNPPELMCSLCSKTFRSKKKLDRHIAIRACAAHLLCPIPMCPRQFIHLSALQQHLEQKHTQQRDFYWTKRVTELRMLLRERGFVCVERMAKKDVIAMLRESERAGTMGPSGDVEEHGQTVHSSADEVASAGFLTTDTSTISTASTISIADTTADTIDTESARACGQSTLRFKCNVCSKSFRQKISLQRHIESVHLDPCYVCPVEACDQTFSSMARLQRHQYDQGHGVGGNSTAFNVSFPPYPLPLESNKSVLIVFSRETRPLGLSTRQSIMDGNRLVERQFLLRNNWNMPSHRVFINGFDPCRPMPVTSGDDAEWDESGFFTILDDLYQAGLPVTVWLLVRGIDGLTLATRGMQDFLRFWTSRGLRFHFVFLQRPQRAGVCPNAWAPWVVPWTVHRNAEFLAIPAVPPAYFVLPHFLWPWFSDTRYLQWCATPPNGTPQLNADPFIDLMTLWEKILNGRDSQSRWDWYNYRRNDL